MNTITRTTTILGLPMIMSYYCYKQYKSKNQSFIISSLEDHYYDILIYIYDHYKDHIHTCKYNQEYISHFSEWRYTELVCESINKITSNFNLFGFIIISGALITIISLKFNKS